MSDRCYDIQPHPAHTTDGTHCPGVPMPRPVPTRDQAANILTTAADQLATPFAAVLFRTGRQHLADHMRAAVTQLGGCCMLDCAEHTALVALAQQLLEPGTPRPVPTRADRIAGQGEPAWLPDLAALLRATAEGLHLPADGDPNHIPAAAAAAYDATVNLRDQLDRANTERARLADKLATMTEVARSNKRHNAYLLGIVERVNTVVERLDREGLATIWSEALRQAFDGDTTAASVPSRRAQDADLEPWIRRAVANPGSIAGRRHGPSWREDEEGYAEEQETIAAWTTRAVLRVLDTAGRPQCERCDQVIGVDDLYDPPLPGIGLWEHKGVCPTAESQGEHGPELPAPKLATAAETDVPDWVLMLVAGLARYEAEHPKLYAQHTGQYGSDAYRPAPCPCSLLKGVPAAVRTRVGREG